MTFPTNMRKAPLALLLAALFVLASCKPRSASQKTKSPAQHTYSAQGMNFRFLADGELKRYGWDSVPFGHLIPRTGDSGPIVYYFLDGDMPALRAAQVRVEYVSKKLPTAESVEGLFGWLKGQFVNDVRNGKVMDEKTVLVTANADNARVLEIHIPEFETKGENGPVIRSAKQMAWAYLDGGEDFWIGLACSAVDPVDFKKIKPKFYKLVESFFLAP